ncbi:MAG: HIT family protein [Saprospiraceae bacterium]
MPSIFSRIIAGEIPCHKVAENDEFIAFLDIHPLSLGHSLVIPKKETDYIFNLEDTALSKLILFSKKVAAAIEGNVDCIRIGVCVIGLEVPHAHIHLIPINQVEDMNFSKPKLQLDSNTLQPLAERIKSTFDQKNPI